MSAVPQAFEQEEWNKLHPLYLFQHEIKDKALKKSAFESMTTIAIALGRKRTRQQLIPYLGQLFVEESNEMKKLILRGLTQLLHPVYIGSPHHSCLILELVMDILCVYSEPDIRLEAYGCMDKVFSFMDVRKAQNILVAAMKKLSHQENNRNIRDLMLRMIPYLYTGVDGDNEAELLKILNTFKESLEDKKLLSEVLTDFIKVMPPAPETEIRAIIELLLETNDRTIFSNLIVPVALLAKVSGEQSTLPYIKTILAFDDGIVISTAFRKFQHLKEVFADHNLTILIERITEYDSQPQEVKNAILETLQKLPVSHDDRQKICQPPSSLQLKNTLSETLCRIEHKQALAKLFHSADPNFQLKMFSKLPPVCELHVEMLARILNGKSWRQKLTVLQNLVTRTNKGENSEILVPKLCEFLGDKIAATRASVCATLSAIMVAREVPIGDIKRQLEGSLQSRNWFERQSVFRLLENLCPGRGNSENTLILQFCQQGQKDPVVNIRSMAAQVKAKIE